MKKAWWMCSFVIKVCVLNWIRIVMCERLSCNLILDHKGSSNCMTDCVCVCIHVKRSDWLDITTEIVTHIKVFRPRSKYINKRSDHFYFTYNRSRYNYKYKKYSCLLIKDPLCFIIVICFIFRWRSFFFLFRLQLIKHIMTPFRWSGINTSSASWDLSL